MKRASRTRRAIAALACVVGCGCSPVNDQTPLVELPLEPYVGRLVAVPTVIAGDTLRFLLDTGGGETLITPSVAEQIGCRPSGRTVGFRMSGERVEFSLCYDLTLALAGHEFQHADVAVFDIASLLPADWPPLAGVIALPTFVNRIITLDLANARLIIESDASVGQRVERMSRIRARMASGTDGRSLTMLLRMAAPAPGWYLFDSANLDVVQVGSHALSDFGVDRDAVRSGPVQFEGVEPVVAQWRSADIIYDGALSEAFMREWVFTLDLPDGGAWVARVGSDEAH